MTARTPQPLQGKAFGAWGFESIGIRWAAAAAILLGIFMFGVYAYSLQERFGEGITGMGTIGSGGAAWGIYIVFAVFFIGVSFTGISVSALIRLFGIEPIRHISRMAELLTIIALMMGALCIVADLGQPLKGFLYLPQDFKA